MDNCKHPPPIYDLEGYGPCPFCNKSQELILMDYIADLKTDTKMSTESEVTRLRRQVERLEEGVHRQTTAISELAKENEKLRIALIEIRDTRPPQRAAECYQSIAAEALKDLS